MRILISIIFSLLLFQSLSAQNIIEGQITDTKGEALSNINVLIYLPGSKVLISFAVSDAKGHFEAEVSSTPDSLDIELSSIHYRKAFRRIENKNQNLKFELIYDTKQLETFTVKASPIVRKGDTISYLVSSFAGKADRAIEDVLRRMPGIEIEPSGKILYQGLPLLKFYVEGLDLMSGRYGVISKNLPHGTVSTVEILENHQPIRILEERVYTQQASLNLKLKRDITTTGTAKLGAGVKPFLWDVNITPMTFTKNFQVLSSYQSNNTGKDVARQLNILTFEELLQGVERPNENPNILSIQAANTPGIEQNRYLDNKIHLLNFNALLRMNKDFQLRSNIYYVNDHQQQKASLHRTLFTPTDTLIFNEDINNQLNENYLMAEFTLSRNVEKNYLNNELKIKSRWDQQLGFANTGLEEIDQSLKNPIKSISNKLRSVNPIGKHLVEFQSYLSYDHSPHRLEISPGQFEENLNDSHSYNKSIQQIDLKRFFADHSARFSFSRKRLSITPRIGFAIRRQTLESNISLKQNDDLRVVGSNFTNELEGRNTQAYFHTNLEYKKGSLTIKAKLPLSWQQTSLDDKISNQGQELIRILFDPRLSINFKMGNFWKAYAAWSHVNRLGDIDQIHYGFIMKNYRNLSQNAAALSESSRHNLSARLSFRNPITSFFNSLSYLYSVSQSNLMYSNQIQSDGTSIVVTTEQPNTSYSHNLNASTSKYFSTLKSTISFRANYNNRKAESLMNGEFFKTSTEFLSFKPALNFRVVEWLNTEYELDATYIQTSIDDEKRSDISLLRHKFNLFAFPTRNQLFSISTEYYNLQENHNFFADLLYRYTFIKQKIDLEFRWNNIFNTKDYTTYQASAFTVYESIYLLRPSQLFFSIKFSF